MAYTHQFCFLEWYKKGQFFGDDKLLFQLFETYAMHRPEESTFFIMDKKIEEINPANERWLDSLERLVTVFFVNDKRARVRERVRRKHWCIMRY